MEGLPATMLSKAGPSLYQPRSLSDWLQRAPGGPGGDLNYGYFGPGSSLLRKDITGAGNTFVGTDFFVNTFGAKVWDALNSQTRLFNLLRKVAWGNTTGWRIRSSRNSSTQPVSEIGALPTVQKAGLQTVYIQPIFNVTSLGVSALAQFLGTLEGGIGDALAVQQEAAMIDHVKIINQQLLASATQRIVTGAATGNATVVVKPQWINIGDTFVDIPAGGGASSALLTCTGFDGSGNPIFTGATTVSNDLLMVVTRAGMASIDDVVNSTGVNVNGTGFSTAQAPGYGSLTASDRDGGFNAAVPPSWSAGSVFGNSGNLRHLSTGMIDQPIDQVRRNGGEPDLIVTGIEQLTRLATILQANQHFIGEGTFQVKQGGEGTLLGYPTGFQVATYKGIPCFYDFDTAQSYQLAANGNALRGSNVYVLDTRYLEIPVLFTTQYLESRDYLQNNMLGVKGIFLTSANLRVRDFVKQAKVIDLSDGVNLT